MDGPRRAASQFRQIQTLLRPAREPGLLIQQRFDVCEFKAAARQARVPEANEDSGRNESFDASHPSSTSPAAAMLRRFVCAG